METFRAAPSAISQTSPSILSSKLHNKATTLLIVILFVKWSTGVDILNIDITPLALKNFCLVSVLNTFWRAALKFLNTARPVRGQLTVKVAGSEGIEVLDAGIDVARRLAHHSRQLVAIGA